MRLPIRVRVHLPKTGKQKDDVISAQPWSHTADLFGCGDVEGTREDGGTAQYAAFCLAEQIIGPVDEGPEGLLLGAGLTGIRR